MSMTPRERCHDQVFYQKTTGTCIHQYEPIRLEYHILLSVQQQTCSGHH
nr:MAG TPA: hypothetical protein [Caudoviricetes sp.]